MDQLAALKVKLQDAERIGAINRSHLEQSAARSTALAARVEALEDELRDHGPPPYSVGRACDQWSHTAVSILSSTPAADLAAKQKAEAERDDRIRRETCDKIIAEWKRIDDETPQLVYHAAGLTAPGAGEGE